MKNTESSNCFYLNLNKNGIKMIFMAKDKGVEIFVCLSREMFELYSYAREEPFICKYDIRDLELIGLIFENHSVILELMFMADGLKVWHSNEFTGELTYRVQAQEILEDLPEEVTSAHILSADDEPHTKIEIAKMKSLSNVLHTLGLQKIENMEIHFKSVNSAIEIVPLPEMVTSNGPVEESDQVFTLSVTYLKTQMLDHLRFNIKKFKTCLGLFDKKFRIRLNFYQNCAKIEVVDKERKDVETVLACLADV